MRIRPQARCPPCSLRDRVIWDSLAILEFLAEAHPEAGLWPKPGDARIQARCVSAEMHSGFQALRQHCPMDFLARTPKADLADEVAADVRRIVALWLDCRREFGGGGPFLFGTFSAADAMYAPVASRFRTYVPDLAAYGDDGTAQAYVEALFALPSMVQWGQEARSEIAARSSDELSVNGFNRP